MATAHGVQWPALRFPPINLWVMPPLAMASKGKNMAKQISPESTAMNQRMQQLLQDYFHDAANAEEALAMLGQDKHKMKQGPAFAAREARSGGSDEHED